MIGFYCGTTTAGFRLYKWKDFVVRCFCAKSLLLYCIQFYPTINSSRKYKLPLSYNNVGSNRWSQNISSNLYQSPIVSGWDTKSLSLFSREVLSKICMVSSFVSVNVSQCWLRVKKDPKRGTGITDVFSSEKHHKCA